MKYTHKEIHHWQRRFIHLLIGIIPILYYAIKEHISRWLHVSPTVWLSALLILTVLLELIRIQQSILLYGQRAYERGTLSSAAWTSVGLILVLLFSPIYQGHEGAFALPIIWSLAIGDPLLGECRRAHCALWLTVGIAWIVLSLIWLLAVVCFGIPYWLVLVMPGLAILGEYLEMRWVDDNFTMMMIPLVFIKMIF